MTENKGFAEKTWGDFDLTLVDDWMDAHRDKMLEDIMRIVRIESVSTPAEPKDPQAPFGKGCREALDEMLLIGREHGFFVKNFDNYVGCISSVDFEKEDMQEHMENTIGFWNHLDVVPVGNNWEYEPFCPTMVEQFMVGRGVDDNKAPAIAMIYMMQCFRELGLPMEHEFCLFVGCDEERGMEDLEYYVAKYPTPRMSIIADAGFPVRYGEKGIMEGHMVTRNSLSEHIVSFQGGVASNMIPDKVTIALKGEEAFCEQLLAELKQAEGTEESKNTEAVRKDDVVEIIYHGISKHSAFPEGSSNAIYGMCKVLLGLSVLGEKDKEILRSIAKLSEEYYGVNTGIAYEDEVSGRTTCAATILEMQEGKLHLTLNIRYAVTADSQKNGEALAQCAEENGMIWVLENDSKPNYFPKEHPAVSLLTDVYNYLAADNKESSVMGGGTYARMLPNAFAYGMGYPASEQDKADKDRLFKPGHGGAHGPDEVLNTNTYFKAVKLFAKAMIAMNRISL